MFNSQFLFIASWFTDQNYEQCVVENRISRTLVINWYKYAMKGKGDNKLNQRK